MSRAGVRDGHGQGDLARARKLREEVLEASRLLGAEHPDTLGAMLFLKRGANPIELNE